MMASLPCIDSFFGPDIESSSEKRNAGSTLEINSTSFISLTIPGIVREQATPGLHGFFYLFIQLLILVS